MDKLQELDRKLTSLLIDFKLALALDKPTWAMKLRERGRFFTENRFRLSTIAFNHLKEYDILMPKIESALRDIYNPIVGKQ